MFSITILLRDKLLKGLNILKYFFYFYEHFSNLRITKKPLIKKLPHLDLSLHEKNSKLYFKFQMLPGVITFYCARDIPGTNSFTPGERPFYTANEELLCDGEVKYFNQPLGIIVAESEAIAERAAKLVTVDYSNVRKPVLDIKIAKTDPSRVTLFMPINATKTGTDVKKVFSGENTIYAQYHFCMETLVCVTHPTEEGLKVYSATQWTDVVQQMTSRVLKMSQNRYL